MKLSDIPFGTTDWATIDATEHPGETGSAWWRTQQFGWCWVGWDRSLRAWWRTQQFGDVRVRRVDYTPGYLADHWCSKGHILLCLSGELHTELDDGRVFILRAGMSYQVADNAEAHRSWTESGAQLFIVD